MGLCSKSRSRTGSAGPLGLNPPEWQCSSPSNNHKTWPTKKIGPDMGWQLIKFLGFLSQLPVHNFLLDGQGGRSPLHSTPFLNTQNQNLLCFLSSFSITSHGHSCFNYFKNSVSPLMYFKISLHSSKSHQDHIPIPSEPLPQKRIPQRNCSSSNSLETAAVLRS